MVAESSRSRESTTRVSRSRIGGSALDFLLEVAGRLSERRWTALPPVVLSSRTSECARFRSSAAPCHPRPDGRGLSVRTTRGCGVQRGYHYMLGSGPPSTPPSPVPVTIGATGGPPTGVVGMAAGTADTGMGVGGRDGRDPPRARWVPGGSVSATRRATRPAASRAWRRFRAARLSEVCASSSRGPPRVADQAAASVLRKPDGALGTFKLAGVGRRHVGQSDGSSKRTRIGDLRNGARHPPSPAPRRARRRRFAWRLM